MAPANRTAGNAPGEGLGGGNAAESRLGEGLHGLQNPYRVDGSVSWHPPALRGWAPMNCYLFQSGDDALLVDSGLTVHEGSVLRQMEGLLRPESKLAIFPLRVGEYDSVCNVGPIVNRFKPHAIYALGVVGGPGWYDISAGSMAGEKVDLEGIDLRRVGREQQLECGDRKIVAFEPVLRLLNTHWIYDEPSRALLTSDVFGYVVRPEAEGPWVVEAGDDETTAEEIKADLLATRYWWLPDANTDELRKGLAAVFDRYDVESIAPAYGCILKGKSVVERHYALLDEVLRELGKKSPTNGSSGVDAK